MATPLVERRRLALRTEQLERIRAALAEGQGTAEACS
jgi:hypothetical protein